MINRGQQASRLLARHFSRKLRVDKDVDWVVRNSQANIIALNSFLKAQRTFSTLDANPKYRVGEILLLASL